ncbi:MAG: hypothetical protein PHZ12_08395 [Paludibacter sp.]|jgi:uncharacterized membrane protein HdeD (DUF308 family)|nr:hypothetical protein [Paludibacter sp.]
MDTKDNATITNPNEMNVVERVKAPTPKFFKTLRAIGIALVAAGGAILASPISLPAGLIAAAGYVILAGGVVTAVSQTAVDTTDSKKTENEVP